MKRIILIVICGGCSINLNAQWNGSTTPSGSIYRDGAVGIGHETTFPGFASLWISAVGGRNPNIMLQNTDAPADNRLWNILGNGGRFRIITEADNFGSVQDALIINRNGINVTTTTFPNGNVGIGTTTPLAKLDVAGSLRWGNTGALLNTDQGACMELRGTGVPYVDLSNDPSSDYDVRMILQNDDLLLIEGGNVVIGAATTAGSFRLAVDGKVGAREVQVTTVSPWPDYVFEPDYKLKPLCEVETFIKTNKHLPEIPTGEEIKADGHKLGEIDVAILKKVEELTLYIINQEKRIASQDGQIKKLEGQLKIIEKNQNASTNK